MFTTSPAFNFTAAQLKKLPTLSTGQADSLKIETPTLRVWLSRCTIEDGEPCNNKISIEQLVNGRWVTSEEYAG